MILSLSTVFALERLRVNVAIDRAHILTADDATAFGKYHRRRAWAALCEAAMTFAVDLDERDVVVDEITTEHDRDRNRVVFCTRWAPQTHDLEFVGGPADGQVYTVPRPRERFYIAIEPHIGGVYCTNPTEPVAPEQRFAYDPAGWNETARRWVSSCEEWSR